MTATELNLGAIQALLPHRPPFLLLDHVESISDEGIVARKAVASDDWFFKGHFPGHPVMPGVLIIEALAQAGAVLAARVSGFDPATQVMYFMAIDKARFRKPVLPGDLLKLHVVPLRKGTSIWKMRGEARVGDAVVAEAEFVAGLPSRSPITSPSRA